VRRDARGSHLSTALAQYVVHPLIGQFILGECPRFKIRVRQAWGLAAHVYVVGERPSPCLASSTGTVRVRLPRTVSVSEPTLKSSTVSAAHSPNESAPGSRYRVSTHEGYAVHRQRAGQRIGRCHKFI
jgi:hypothetical protein